MNGAAGVSTSPRAAQGGAEREAASKSARQGEVQRAEGVEQYAVELKHLREEHSSALRSAQEQAEAAASAAHTERARLESELQSRSSELHRLRTLLDEAKLTARASRAEVEAASAKMADVSATARPPGEQNASSSVQPARS